MKIQGIHDLEQQLKDNDKHILDGETAFNITITKDQEKICSYNVSKKFKDALKNILENL